MSQETIVTTDINSAPVEIDGVTYSNDDVVTVLHGWGKVSVKDVHWIDTVRFEGGVARNVPFELARKWRKIPGMSKGIHILPSDATESEFMKKTGIQPMAPSKFAAMLGAYDLDKLAAELGPERVQEIADKLGAIAQGKVVRDSQGKIRRTPGRPE